MTPGLYKVHFKAGDYEHTEMVEVLKDPHAEGSIESIRKQTAFALKLYEAINETVTMINESEAIRKELQDNIDEMKPKAKDAAQALLEELTAVADQLYDINLTGAREDSFRNPMKLYGRLSALASDVNGSGIDFPPTDQQVAVYEVLRERLDEASADYEKALSILQSINTKHKLEIGVKQAKP